MKNIIEFILIIFMLLTNTACNKTDENSFLQNEPSGVSQIENTQNSESVSKNEDSNDEDEENDMTSINITVGTSTFTAKFYDNETARALSEQFPMTVNMSELNGNEKYYYLPDKLPADSERIGNINTGDLMLYGSDCVVLFYKSFSTSYSYTKIGYIEDVSGLAAALGNGSVEVTFSQKSINSLMTSEL